MIGLLKRDLDPRQSGAGGGFGLSLAFLPRIIHHASRPFGVGPQTRPRWPRSRPGILWLGPCPARTLPPGRSTAHLPSSTGRTRDARPD